MQDRPNMVIELQGHICCKQGGRDVPDFDSKLDNLSETRAKAVLDFLIENGVSPSRLRYKGFGSSKKIKDDYMDKVAAKLNMRVEVYILSE